MNKQCYRVIFSRSLGELRVVSELARSCGAMPGQRRGTGTPRLWVTLSSAVWRIGLALFAGPVLADGIVADTHLAPEMRPEVISIQDKPTLVNINPPNPAGISHNQYQQFDVGHHGAILNNSAIETFTQLGGDIPGNSKFDSNTPSASVIINEVNSSNPSRLQGFLEVAGGAAQVIIANPSGVICNGCGTINAGRMTLTTGKPQLNADGTVAGYHIERGLIRVEGSGLNSLKRHDTDYVDLLAHAVRVNAEVRATKGIRVIAGRNHISVKDKALKMRPVQGNNPPEIAVDMGRLGGMYSGHIQMIGTEAGVGVRNQGGQVLAKNLKVSSGGKLIWQTGAEGLHTRADDRMDLTARENLEISGNLYSGGQLIVDSRLGGIKHSGNLTAGGEIALHTKETLYSTGDIKAGSDVNGILRHHTFLTIGSLSDVEASGNLTCGKTISVIGRQLNLDNSRLTAKNVSLSARVGNLNLQQAQLDSEEFIAESKGNLNTKGAKIRAGTWHITADSLFNQAGEWSQMGQGVSKIMLSGELDNTDGGIKAHQLGLHATSLNNLRGSFLALGNNPQYWRLGDLSSNQEGVIGANGGLQLDINTLNNHQGTLQSHSHLTITAKGDINNHRGKMLTDADLTLNSQGNVDNHAGVLEAKKDIGWQGTLRSKFNNNAGKVLSEGALSLMGGSVSNREGGTLQSQQELDLDIVGEWDNQDGNFVSNKSGKVRAHHLMNSWGRIQSFDTLDMHFMGLLDNRHGVIHSRKAQNLHADVILNMPLATSADLSMPKACEQPQMTESNITSEDALTLQAVSIFNRDGAVLKSQTRAEVTARNLYNNAGQIISSGPLTLLLMDKIDNRQGKILTSGALNLSSGKFPSMMLLNQWGKISSGETLEVSAHSLKNQSGKLESRADSLIQVDSGINNYLGEIVAGANVNLVTQGNINNEGGVLSARQDVIWQGNKYSVFNNDSGNVNSMESLSLRCGQLLNRRRGLMKSKQHFELDLAEGWNNQGGSLISGGSATLYAHDLNNLNGTIQAVNSLDMQFDSGLDNNSGSIASEGTLNVRSGDILNTQGNFFANQAIKMVSGQIENNQGVVNSLDRLDVYTRQLNNCDGGTLNGADDIYLTADKFDNTAGRLESASSVLVIKEKLDNRQGHILAYKSLKISGDNAVTSSFFNQSGSIQSAGTLEVGAGIFDNLGGTLQSQLALTLNTQQDFTHNDGDTLLSNEALTLNMAGILTNAAQWLLPGVLTVNSKHFTNMGKIVANKVLVRTNEFVNQGSIDASILDLNIKNLDNRASLTGENLSVRSQAIENQGSEARIAAAELLSLQTTKRLSNLEGALIYSGGALHLASDEVIANRSSHIQAVGDIFVEAKRLDNLCVGLEIEQGAEKTGYRWHRHNLYWRSYGSGMNTDVNTMARTTRRFTFRDDDAATNDPYGTLLNIDTDNKKAEVSVVDNSFDNMARFFKIKTTPKLVNVNVNYLALAPNDDGSYDMTFYEMRGPRQGDSHARRLSSSGFYDSRDFHCSAWTPFHNTFWREHDRGVMMTWHPEQHIDIAVAPFVSDYNNLRERTATGTITRDKLISAGESASIISGGNINLQIAGQIVNDASTISAHGNLTTGDGANLINRGYSQNERREEHIVDHYDRDARHWHPTFNLDETTALATFDAIINGNGNVTLKGVHLDNITVNPAQINSFAAALNPMVIDRAQWAPPVLPINSDSDHWVFNNTLVPEFEKSVGAQSLALIATQGRSVLC